MFAPHRVIKALATPMAVYAGRNSSISLVVVALIRITVRLTFGLLAQNSGARSFATWSHVCARKPYYTEHSDSLNEEEHITHEYTIFDVPADPWLV